MVLSLPLDGCGAQSPIDLVRVNDNSIGLGERLRHERAIMTSKPDLAVGQFT
jgi:hypothetical protein